MSARPLDGNQAFAMPGSDQNDPQHGASLRDIYAGLAMHALLSKSSNDIAVISSIGSTVGRMPPEEIAHMAFEMAQAMVNEKVKLEQRNSNV